MRRYGLLWIAIAAFPFFAAEAAGHGAYYVVSGMFETALRGDSTGFAAMVAPGAVLKLDEDRWPLTAKTAVVVAEQCSFVQMRSCNPQHLEIQWECPSLREKSDPPDLEQYATVELEGGRVKELDLRTGPTVCTRMAQ